MYNTHMCTRNPVSSSLEAKTVVDGVRIEKIMVFSTYSYQYCKYNMLRIFPEYTKNSRISQLTNWHIVLEYPNL